MERSIVKRKRLCDEEYTNRDGKHYDQKYPNQYLVTNAG